MSTALPLPQFWEVTSRQAALTSGRKQVGSVRLHKEKPAKQSNEVVESLGFYRRHTENLLRRYLYASMQIGRAPSLLSNPIARGWASSRPIRTFEDAVIFVLDIEKCLSKLDDFDRKMLSRIVLQEYTQVEAAGLLGVSARTISYKFPAALDRLTEKLLEADILVLPH